MSATFSEAPNPTTVTAATVLLTDANGNAVPVTVSYNAVTDTVTLTPSSPLAALTYTATLKGNANGPGIAAVLGRALGGRLHVDVQRRGGRVALERVHGADDDRFRRRLGGGGGGAVHRRRAGRDHRDQLLQRGRRYGDAHRHSLDAPTAPCWHRPRSPTSPRPVGKRCCSPRRWRSTRGRPTSRRITATPVTTLIDHGYFNQPYNNGDLQAQEGMSIDGAACVPDREPRQLELLG